MKIYVITVGEYSEEEKDKKIVLNRVAKFKAKRCGL